MSPIMHIMPRVYFKMIYNNEMPARWYHVNPSWKIDNFINIMKTRIIRDFGLEQFELVEAGQNTPSGTAEDGISLDRNESVSLKDKYGESLNVAFYIRPLHLIPMQHINTNINVECMVCFENKPLILYYTCSHAMCRECIDNCLRNSIYNCPMCRCSQINPR